ncbi:uncharacterized protein BJX67DRAFT_359215 [Aspergillus lucknowensis]|uniref:F-box domain-containing protein n=1 Tax=Aspergillus lucknowensis TaxID=176173 RepID=A0ABR4LLS6_9EURO
MDRLPPELFDLIGQYLSGADRKNLRLTSRTLHKKAPFHIKRVFLSPCHRDIEVFRAILADDHRRQEVRELVWDDTKFYPPPQRHHPAVDLDSDPDSEEEWMPPMHGDFVVECDWEPAPESEDAKRARLRELYPSLYKCALTTPAHWFWMPQQETVVDTMEDATGKAFSRWFPVPDADALRMRENDEITKRLAAEQTEIINAGIDRELFRAGLLSFPRLERVIVTPTAHRMFPFLHEYDTPLLRCLPNGFRAYNAEDWIPLHSAFDDAPYDECSRWRWRGFNIVVEELNNLRGRHHVSELLVNPGRKLMGVNHNLFWHPESPASTYATLYQLFQTVQLTRLELSLRMPSLSKDWDFLRNGLLKRALAQLTQLEVLSLYTTVETNIDVRHFHTETDATCLTDYLSPHAWPHLRSLTLGRLLVLHDDLLTFIRALPAHVVDLNLETVKIYAGDWRSLYASVKEDITITRGTGQRTDYAPRRRFRFSTQQQTTSRFICVDDDLHEFLYGDGPNPFDGDLPPHRIQFGFGVVIDEYDHRYRAPYVPPEWYRSVGPGRWVDIDIPEGS